MAQGEGTKPTTVSIVTTVYNCEKYIEECLKSILAQGYPHIEHIVQDAASTDDTLKILQKYTDKIKLKSEPDRGQSDGLNRALQRSTGDIILVLNADDILLPGACSWAVENMKKYPDAAVIYGDVYIINEKGETLRLYKAPADYSFDKLLCVELVPPAQAAFIRRSHFEEVGFYADATLDTCPDYEMWVRIGAQFQMQYVPGIVAKYRVFATERMESKQKKSVKRFFRAKKLVMDKILHDPDSKESIKTLKTRAYVGLNIWACTVSYGEEKRIEDALRYGFMALQLAPLRKKLIVLSKIILMYYWNFLWLQKIVTTLNIRKIFGKYLRKIYETKW